MGFSSEFIVQFASVFIIFLIWIIALTPIRKAQASQEEGYDNSNPRDQYNRLSSLGKRAVNAANNTFEGLVFFSIAVFTQAFSRMLHIVDDDKSKRDKITVAADFFCIAYVVIRVIYLPLYWYDFSSARSLVWTIGVFCIVALFAIAFI